MAKWLKAAEDLLEVVDRRAKLVVSDYDQQPESNSPGNLLASNGEELKSKKTKRKEKAQSRLQANEPPKTSSVEPGQGTTQPSPDNAKPDTLEVTVSSENDGAVSSNSPGKTSKEIQPDSNEEGTILSGTLPEATPSDVDKPDTLTASEISSTINDLVASSSSVNGESNIENTSEGHKELPSVSVGEGDDVIDKEHSVDAEQITKPGVEDIPSKVGLERSELENVGTHTNNDAPSEDVDRKDQTSLEVKMQQEDKCDVSPARVQDQLDEAQGLLKTAKSTGQSKEARLARVCAGLSSRLQEYKSENKQLEELLVSERERRQSYEARVKQLQQELSASKIEVSRVESNMSDALAAKNSEIENLVNSMDSLKKQAATSEGKLGSLQANMESIMRNRELTETRMMQALREELASVERRAEEEHAAHNATKMAAMEREVELEHRALEASTALARIQRTADERASRAADLEQKLAVVEAECASLTQELQDMEARVRRGQKRSPDEASQALQMQAWQEEVERARQGQRDAESKLSSLEAEMQKMRVEMAGMKRDAEHYSRQEHMELEKRYRELTDLLYYKQTQLETMASEKAATEFQLEKEAKRFQEAQVEAERSKVPRRASTSWEEDTDLKTLVPLPLYHRHMAGASLQLQKAVKLIDSGAVRATRFLWRYPVARVLLLFYLVFVHLFLMYLLHRLQEQADNFSASEVAASMGLNYPTLP
ncbi:golgin candidate 1-like [Papaver somniferum]|uniref:golgin candidate 1-like n=1 Tax=Papaver somniferum TaxID=3469 RepID=UPI000E6FABBF|nr:golgin candidate 1-like [Papaver somniferum]